MSARRCAVHVGKRAYSRPGQCEKRRGVKLVKYRDVQIAACTPHRQAIERGLPLELAR